MEISAPVNETREANSASVALWTNELEKIWQTRLCQRAVIVQACRQAAQSLAPRDLSLPSPGTRCLACQGSFVSDHQCVLCGYSIVETEPRPHVGLYLTLVALMAHYGLSLLPELLGRRLPADVLVRIIGFQSTHPVATRYLRAVLHSLLPSVSEQMHDHSIFRAESWSEDTPTALTHFPAETLVTAFRSAEEEALTLLRAARWGTDTGHLYVVCPRCGVRALYDCRRGYQRRWQCMTRAEQAKKPRPPRKTEIRRRIPYRRPDGCNLSFCDTYDTPLQQPGTWIWVADALALMHYGPSYLPHLVAMGVRPSVLLKILAWVASPPPQARPWLLRWRANSQLWWQKVILDLAHQPKVQCETTHATKGEVSCQVLPQVTL